jgi:secondary thiamine-phosphate synthase enzyme
MIRTSTIHAKTEGNCHIIDITPKVSRELESSGIKEGTVTVFVAGSTAGITTVEFEQGLVEDLKTAFNRIAPAAIPYEHNKKWGDGNGHAHVRASLLGASQVVPVKSGQMMLGTWQQIVLIDFDNRARNREIIVQVTGD